MLDAPLCYVLATVRCWADAQSVCGGLSLSTAAKNRNKSSKSELKTVKGCIELRGAPGSGGFVRVRVTAFTMHLFHYVAILSVWSTHHLISQWVLTFVQGCPSPVTGIVLQRLKDEVESSHCIFFVYSEVN